MDITLTKAEAEVRADQRGAAGEGATTWRVNAKRILDAAIEDAKVVEVASASEDVEVTEAMPGDKTD